MLAVCISLRRVRRNSAEARFLGVRSAVPQQTWTFGLAPPVTLPASAGPLWSVNSQSAQVLQYAAQPCAALLLTGSCAATPSVHCGVGLKVRGQQNLYPVLHFFSAVPPRQGCRAETEHAHHIQSLVQSIAPDSVDFPCSTSSRQVLQHAWHAVPGPTSA